MPILFASFISQFSFYIFHFTSQFDLDTVQSFANPYSPIFTEFIPIADCSVTELYMSLIISPLSVIPKIAVTWAVVPLI